MSLTRRILVLLLVLGAAGNLGGTGTMASFNASTTNANSSYATGSIVLSNLQKTTTNTCFSNGTNATNGGSGTSTNTNSNTACDAAFTLATKKPGETATVDLNLANVGNLPGTLKLLAALHTDPAGGANTKLCTSTNGTDTAYHGTGDICEKLQLTIQRYTTDARATASVCVYGLNTDGTTTTCDALDANFNLKHFTATSDAATTGISLSTLAAATSSDDTDMAFLTVTIKFPDGGIGQDNAFQGRVATWAFQWLLEQQ